MHHLIWYIVNSNAIIIFFQNCELGFTGINIGPNVTLGTRQHGIKSYVIQLLEVEVFKLFSFQWLFVFSLVNRYFRMHIVE